MKAPRHDRPRPGHRRLRLPAATVAASLSRSTLVVVLVSVVVTVAGPSAAMWFGSTPASAAVTAKASVSAWKATEAALPANSAPTPLVSLGALACPVTGTCVDTGDYTDTSANQQGLIETLASGTWTALEAPLPGD